MTRASIIALSLLLGASALAGCGRQSELDRPAPMWGAKAKADYAAQKAAQADQATNATEAGQPGQPPAQGPGSNPYANPAPPAEAPIPGEKTYPSGAPATGAQPQP